MTEPDRKKPITADVDRQAKRVRVTVDSITRTAAFYGDQGCVIHPANHDGVHFKPVPVRTTLPDAASQAWPMGDAPSTAPWPAKLDRAKLQAAVDLAFADPAGLTAAMVVVHKGQIVGERYMAGITKDTQLESWSMGKSLTATLVGLAIKDGAFSLDDPAPVPDWRRPGDPRGAIRVRDVMNMASGLSFTGQDDRWMDPTWQYHDHFFIYAGAVDAFRYATTSPVEFAPNTVGRYRNSDPMTLGFLVRQHVEKKGEVYLTHPQRALFDKIGIRRQVLEPDPWGNFLLSGYDYGTARNWARLGLLYLATACGTASGCCRTGSRNSSARPRRPGASLNTAASSGSTASAGGTCRAMPISCPAPAASTPSSCRRTISSSCAWATSAARRWAPSC